MQFWLKPSFTALLRIYVPGDDVFTCIYYACVRTSAEYSGCILRARLFMEEMYSLQTDELKVAQNLGVLFKAHSDVFTAVCLLPRQTEL